MFIWLVMTNLLGIGAYLNWSSPVNNELSGFTLLLPPNEEILKGFYYAVVMKTVMLIGVTIIFVKKPLYPRVWIAGFLLFSSSMSIIFYSQSDQALGFRTLLIACGFVAYIFVKKSSKQYFLNWHQKNPSL